MPFPGMGDSKVPESNAREWSACRDQRGTFQQVCQIYHHFIGEEAITILAIVNRGAGQVDTLTGDQLEMDTSHLCVCEKSIENRKQNNLLSNK